MLVVGHDVEIRIENLPSFVLARQHLKLRSDTTTLTLCPRCRPYCTAWRLLTHNRSSTTLQGCPKTQLANRDYGDTASKYGPNLSLIWIISKDRTVIDRYSRVLKHANGPSSLCKYTHVDTNIQCTYMLRAEAAESSCTFKAHKRGQPKKPDEFFFWGGVGFNLGFGAWDSRVSGLREWRV